MVTAHALGHADVKSTMSYLGVGEDKVEAAILGIGAVLEGTA